MSDKFKTWQQLNESLGYPLGIKSFASLGIIGTQLDEKKHTKKMDGDEEIMLKKDGEDDGGGEDVDVDVKDDHPEGCKCDKHGTGPMDPKGDENRDLMMKKKMKAKKMKKEHLDFTNYAPPFEEKPEVGTDEYRTAFWKSIQDHMGDPNKKYDGGVNLGEEVLLEPKDEISPQPQPNPTAGQVGSSPVTRIGEFASEPPEMSDWEKHWSRLG